MAKDALGEQEQIVMLAILRLGEGAYGMPILEQIRARTGRDVARAAVYIALRRLENKGLLRSWKGEPTAERGGRAKRFFEVTAEGLEQLRESHRALTNMWDGIESLVRERPQ